MFLAPMQTDMILSHSDIPQSFIQQLKMTFFIKIKLGFRLLIILILFFLSGVTNPHHVSAQTEKL